MYFFSFHIRFKLPANVRVVSRHLPANYLYFQVIGSSIELAKLETYTRYPITSGTTC